jgi:hypothetical protein
MFQLPKIMTDLFRKDVLGGVVAANTQIGYVQVFAAKHI